MMMLTQCKEIELGFGCQPRQFENVLFNISVFYSNILSIHTKMNECSRESMLKIPSSF